LFIEILAYDALGRRITKTQTQDTTERFAFDPAHNLLDKGNEENRVKGNRLNTYQDKRYEYDTFGNMTRKRISNHTQMKFEYDAEHQMQRSIITKHGITQTFHYTYDPFGRRIGKWDEFGVTHFLWDGNRLLSETRNTQSITYVYEQFGFTPVAQIDSSNNIHYYHNDQLGTPRELTDQEGNITWEAQYTTWGNTLKVDYKQTQSKIHEDVQQQPLRFQGQYYDHETGLHYNRFRYYDPDIGRFISQDPIGLMGGINNYQYAPNPMGWIDPLGLAPLGQTGHTVYGLFEGTSKTPYYIGITERDPAIRMGEHMESGRYGANTISKDLKTNLTTEKARAYEQKYMEKYETKTGKIGEPISETNKGNKVNSFDKDRTDERGKAFKEEYDKLCDKDCTL
jgi:RHS repeat-associated protein